MFKLEPTVDLLDDVYNFKENANFVRDKLQEIQTSLVPDFNSPMGKHDPVEVGWMKYMRDGIIVWKAYYFSSIQHSKNMTPYRFFVDSWLMTLTRLIRGLD